LAVRKTLTAPKALVRLHAEAVKQKAVLSTVERTDVCGSKVFSKTATWRAA
jgi:hypothetical protein